MPAPPGALHAGLQRPFEISLLSAGSAGYTWSLIACPPPTAVVHFL